MVARRKTAGRICLLACLLFAWVSPLVSIRAQTNQFIQGIAVFEAENFNTNIARNAQQWEFTNTISGFSGTGYMQALPDSGVNRNTTWVDSSPEMQYLVHFAHTGTHYVWVRGYATDVNGDSLHAGLNGTTNTAAAINFQNSFNAWVWTNRTLSGTVPTLSVGTTGIHTNSIWMREDGMRVDRILLTTNANFLANPGNAWHIPNNPEALASLPSMRVPLSGMLSNTAVALYNGNQDIGPGGNPGNQTQAGSLIFFKHITNSTWSTLPMFFYTGGGNNKYYSNSIPANTFSGGDTVQYYLRIWYTDHLPTYLYGNDNASFATEVESVAQADPFSYTVQWPLEPTGSYISYTNLSTSGTLEARIYENSGHISLVGPDLAGNPLANTINFSPPAARIGAETYLVGRVLSSQTLSNGIELVQQLGATSVVSRITFPHDGVMRYEVIDWGGLTPSQTAITAPSDANEHVYGFGEKFNTFDQSGLKVRIMTLDPPGDKGDNAYKVHPWFISTRGYGFHLDSSAESFFDMRAQFADRYVVSNMFSTLKFNVVYGPKLTDVLSRYTGYTGRPPLPPKWAFAPWMSSDIWRSGGEVRYLITRYREHGIPGSAIVFDSPWEIAYNDFTWNMTQFGNGGTFEGQFWPGFASVTDMMTFLRTNGWKVICWMTPFVNTSSFVEHTSIFGVGGVPGQNTGKAANYDAGALSNFFVKAGAPQTNLVVRWWKGHGSPVDFTNPDARAWISSQLSNLVTVSMSGGHEVIGGFKTDDGEMGHPTGDVYIPMDAVYFDGRTGVEMRNAYSLEYHKAIWNVLGTNGILFARSGFTGSQAYPGYWAGDNAPNFGQENGLQSAIVAGQSAAMSGYSMWSHDVGGYQNCCFSSTPTNLFLRWTQFGALSPLMQMHRQVDSPIASQYPWGYGAEALENYRFWARLHTALFPYLYSYAAESATNGLPIIRPLVLMHQDDANTFGIRHTYLFGNELLAAVIITNVATMRTVYLPQGKWHDFFTNVTYNGGQNIIWTNANQSQMPLFVREGAIIPMISTNVATLCDTEYVANPNLVTWGGSLEFLVYPTTNSSFTVYDGTSLQCQTNQTIVSATLNTPPRPILMRFFTQTEPFSVERNGVRMPKFTDATAFSAADLGWRYDSTNKFVHAKFAHTGGSAQISFGPDSVGDGISDSWRQNFFGDATETNEFSCATCDFDGDGMTNFEEFRAGTAPNNTASAFFVQTASASGGQFSISWPSQPGIPYRVLWKDEMRDDVLWQTNNAEFVGDGTVLNWDDPEAADSPTGQRYYKVIVP
jgi:alpha-D-xyloside xylohydrolase